MYKKILVGLILCLLMVQITVLGETDITIPGKRNQSNCYQITMEQYGKQLKSNTDGNENTGASSWYRVKAPEKGIYVISFRDITDEHTLWNGDLTVRILSMLSGKEIKSTLIKEDSFGTISFSAGKNEEFYINLSSRVYVKFSFGVCFNDIHLQSDMQLTSREATCKQTGIIITPCLLCGNACYEEEIEKLPHLLGDWTVTKKATCTESGETVQKCTVCHDVINSQVIPAVGHEQSNEKIILQATCTQKGLKGIQCNICGEVLSSTEIPRLEHQPGAFATVINATCTQNGTKEQRCTLCNALLNNEAIPASGHIPGIWKETIPATCLENGHKEQYCTVCNAIVNDETIPAFGHTYTEWEITKEATKKEEGERTRFCIHCGDVQRETIEKKPKIFGIF